MSETPNTNAAPITVEVNKLTKRFGDFTAVNGISFNARQGEVFGFLGPNGAGKSTTIRMLCGLLGPTAGTAKVGGFDVGRQATRVRGIIGYMSQKFSLYDDLRVEENIEFFGGLYGLGRSRLAERKAWAMRMANLEGREKDMTGTLATGYKQRLALGCAVLHEPRILFLDEPTSGVDPLARRGFWDLIYQMARQGVTVFVTTHFMDEAEYCYRLALIQGGNIVAYGSPREIKQRHLGGKVLRVRGAGVVELLEAIRALPHVRDASIFGNAVHVTSDTPEAAEPEVNALLTDRGLEPNLDWIEPSLEDVFVRLMGRAEVAP